MKQFLIACLLVLTTGAGSLAHAAEPVKQWRMVTDMGLSTPLDSVRYFVAADDDEFFSVVLADGVFSFVQQVSFLEVEDTGIRQLTVSDAHPRQTLVHDVLHLSACRSGSEAVIYTMEGTAVKRQPLKSEQADVDVHDLPQGIYVLRIGRTSFRFVKQ